MAKQGDVHPAEALRALEAELAGARAPWPGYVVRGEELYFKNRALDVIAAKAREAGFELCTHDADATGFELARLLDDLVGTGLFASQRLVVVHHPEDFVTKEGPLERPIARFLEGKRGTVVLASESLRADNRSVKAIVAAGGRLLSFRRLWEKPPPWETWADPRSAELVVWLRARAKELGLTLSGEQALMLVEATGNDLAELEGQLAELRLAGASNVFESLEGHAAVSPFEVASAIARGDAHEGLAGVEALYRSGQRGRDGRREVQPTALREILFSALRAKLRQGLAGAMALAGGQSVAEASTAAGVASPLQRREFERSVRARSVRAWREMNDDLARLERGARSGVAVDVDDFAVFVTRWRRAGQPRA